MLIRESILERIRSGDVTLAFRRWRRQTVKTGSTLKTAMVILAIQVVEKTNMRNISEIDAHRAGNSEKDALIKDLSRREGDLYKITFAYAGEDPRIQLRADDTMRDSKFTEIREALAKIGFGVASRELDSSGIDGDPGTSDAARRTPCHSHRI